MKKDKLVGLFFIHGLFGSPYEFNAPAEMFKRQGYLTHQVVLPAHGETPKTSFDEVDLNTLVTHVINEYKRFSQSVDSVVVIGHSLGSVLSLLLGSKHPSKLKAICCFSCPLNTAFYIIPWFYFGLKPTQLLKGIQYVPHGWQTGFKGPRPNIKALTQCYQDGKKILRELNTALSQITTPVWLCHSWHDLIVPHH
jgi:esterase/lipase